MFSINNGLLMSKIDEKRMDKGLFVIVPYANDESKRRLGNGISRYSVRVLDKGHKEMLEVIPDSKPKINWAQLDGRELEFLSYHRPPSQVSVLCILRSKAPKSSPPR